MKITKITINNFRAFKYECTFDLPKGKNLLLYGENGSGKSSLFQALNLCLAPATTIGQHKNIFANTVDSSVKLEISEGNNPPDKLEWDETSHPYTQAVIVEASKTKGFMDYRALLETHFVHRQEDSVDIFNLVVKTLLANIQNPITKKLFGDEWKLIELETPDRKSAFHTEYLSSLVSNFNAGLSAILSDLTHKANNILNIFEQNVVIDLSLPTEAMTFDADFKVVQNNAITLTAKYYGHEVPRHHIFLNEARLSAIAVSIYLGALLLNPPSKLRVLFLDDVLIGLDMSNRLPLLDVLDTFFPDWQTIIATYDKVWFDMVWRRVDHSEWENAELYCRRDDECDVPVNKGNIEYLTVAQQHIDKGDLKAAAIYIRSAYEAAMKDFCHKCHLPVPYYDNMNQQDSNDFWDVLNKQKLKSDKKLLGLTLVKELELSRTYIMNQLSHTTPVIPVRSEVEKAWAVTDKLQKLLEGVKKSDLKKIKYGG